MNVRHMAVMAGVAAALVLPAAAEPAPLDGVVAYVNDRVITGGDLRDAVGPARQRILEAYQGEERQSKIQKLYDDALRGMIERFLILAAYEKLEQKLPEWVIDERINEIIHESFKDDRMELMTALAKNQMTFDEWRSQIRENIVAQAMRSDRIDRHIRVSPRRIREEYTANADAYRSPDRVSLRMIMLKKGSTADEAVARKAKAAEILQKLKDGEDFAAAAKASSEGGKAENGGDWGWVEPRMFRPEIAKVLADITPASLSDVIETEDGFYILKVEGREKGTVRPFDEVQAQVERDLRQREGDALYRTWVDGLKKSAYIKVLDLAPYIDLPSP